MGKKSFLSYEAKLLTILFTIIFIIFSFFVFSDELLTIKEKIVGFYNNNISNYPIWLQVLPFVIPILVVIVIKIVSKNRSKYTQDSFYNINWTWQWHKNNIVNLQCYCPICQEALYYDDTTSNFTLEVSKVDFICDKCEKVVGSIANENKKLKSSEIIIKEIKRQILRKLAEDKNLTN